MKRESIRKMTGFALLLAGLMAVGTGCASEVSIDESSISVSPDTIQVQKNTATVMSQKEFAATFEERGTLEQFKDDSGYMSIRVDDIDGYPATYYYREVTDQLIMEDLGRPAFTAEYEKLHTVTEADLKDMGRSVDTEIAEMKHTRLIDQGENYYIYQSVIDYTERSVSRDYESVFVEQGGKIFEIDGVTEDMTETGFRKTMSEIVSIEVPVITGSEFESILSEYGDVEASDEDLFDYQLKTDDFQIVYGNDILSAAQMKLLGDDKFLSVIKSVVETDDFSLSNINLEALGSNYYHYSATELASDKISLPCDLYFFVQNGKINLIMGDDYGTDSKAYQEAITSVTGIGK